MSNYQALRINLSGTIIPTLEQLPVNRHQLKANEVLIDVNYSSINYKDALAITGKSRIMRTYPTTCGIDAAGIIAQSKDPRFKIGDKVIITGFGIGEKNDGGMAEKLQTKADYVLKCPPSFSLKDAMTLGTAGFTAAISVMRLEENNTTVTDAPVLVTGATGGVGSVAIHLLSKMGYTVHALTRKTASAGDYLRQLGAAEIIDYHLLERGSKPLEKARYQAAIDCVGGETLAWITRVIQPFGNIAACGLASGIELNTTVMPFILRGVSLLGVDSVNYPMAKRTAAWQLLAEHFDADSLQLILHQVVALDKVVANVNTLMDGEIKGRFVVAVKAD